MERTFRIGPIRPPSEADSLLLQVTNGCTWNKCKFCQLYKHTRFRAYSADSIKKDIDNMVYQAEKVKKYKKDDGTWDIDGINSLLSEGSQEERECLYMVANWLVKGGENVFLQDGNTTALSSGRLSDVLIYLKKAFPEIKRITSYGRAENLAKVSAEEYAELKEAGLDRIHSGFESGSDEVLKKINKGVTSDEEIRAGKNIKKGGIELSVYFMPGVGGRELTGENARGTARVVNETNPDFLRIRTAAVKPGTELYEDFLKGDFILCSDDEKLMEIRTVIELADKVDTRLVSDHIINLLQGVRGRMIGDRDKMLAVIDGYLESSPEEKMMFQAARRMAMVTSPKEMERLPQREKTIIKQMVDSAKDGPYEWEIRMNSLISRYI
ncbi:MAG TPA: radical SAM protein [Candidatus Copromorpha excrementigallinarum]|uniref:Radical SAM protein n=1 Tax=Candidatus Allocopromorpha excrementigallinarum TaxID=2840742 RepID=A0A9D1I1H3_9FIRM|nr:radical SAM protein [Candidatus Copromorpha excrementigallinarum]